MKQMRQHKIETNTNATQLEKKSLFNIFLNELNK